MEAWAERRRAGGRHDGCYVLVTVATRMRRQMAKQNQMTHRGIADAALYLAGLALHGVNVRQALAPLYRCERALTKGERAEARRVASRQVVEIGQRALPVVGCGSDRSWSKKPHVSVARVATPHPRCVAVAGSVCVASRHATAAMRSSWSSPVIGCRSCRIDSALK